jgi:hypothetical protein
MKLEDYDKYYINGSDHYLMPKDEFVELFDEMVNWREESKQLKEVIDKIKEWINTVQQNKDNKHLDPFISTDELDDLLNILNEVE